MDLLDQIDHDHTPMSELIGQLRELVARGDPSGAHEGFHEHILALRDVLLEHFAEEEEVVFPALSKVRPQSANDLDSLCAAHDGICGCVLRLAAIAERGPGAFVSSYTSVAQLFARLDSTYMEHAQRERTLLRSIAESLSAEERRALG